MEYKYLKDLCKEFDVSEKEVYRVLLEHGNLNGQKILHELDREMIFPTKIFNELINIRDYYKDELTPLDVIINKKGCFIPKDNKARVYFLFRENQLRYVGQTVDLPRRIREHYTDGKDFDSFYTEVVFHSELDMIEMSYILRENPIDNIHFWSNRKLLKEYLKEIVL